MLSLWVTMKCSPAKQNTVLMMVQHNEKVADVVILIGIFQIVQSYLLYINKACSTCTSVSNVSIECVIPTGWRVVSIVK